MKPPGPAATTPVVRRGRVASVAPDVTEAGGRCATPDHGEVVWRPGATVDPDMGET